MAELSDSITSLKGIGDKKALCFKKLGVFSLYDLISFFPRKYEDRSQITPIALTCDGESVCIQAFVADEPRLVRIRRGMDLVKFKIADETGIVDVTYFNQSYLKNTLHRGEEYIFFGKIELSGRHRSLSNPVFEKCGGKQEITGKIVPVYRLTSGITQKNMIQSIRASLDLCLDSIPEVLPEDVLRYNSLPSAQFAYENIHFPKDFPSLENARRRLIFEELFVLAVALGKTRSNRRKLPGAPIPYCDFEEFYSSLPFSPTNAQRKAISDAAADLSSGNVMNRLVQGDVGSGKTLVAAALCYMVHKAGHMCAFMAPTEILAGQHLNTLRSLLEPFGIRVEKLTGSATAKEKREIRELLQHNEIDVLVGTHALFSQGVEYQDLALVITDEQHRFGVAQRAALAEKSSSPHVLVMSATPIPRTLALIIYGDLDVSVIGEMPAGRKSVDTYLVDENYRDRLNHFILKQHQNGNQTFVVCPMVEENEENSLSLKSAEEHSLELQSSLPGLKIGCVHGKMKAKDKDQIMASFAAGEIDVLVSTTVIEVGVDVPNATLMIIENAERFGLSQLHQLRGRVGRGTARSYCVLVSSTDDENSKARLNILCKTNDGFQISEEDLRLRGPGDFFGSRQHGLPEMHVANLGADVNIMKKAQDQAAALLAADPELELPDHIALKERINKLIDSNFNRFN